MATVRHIRHNGGPSGFSVHAASIGTYGPGLTLAPCGQWGSRAGRDSVLIASGYGPHVWLWGKHYGLNLMQIPIIPAGGLDGRTRALLIDRYKPTALACTPSYALHLALGDG